MPAYADAIWDALDRRDRARASVCPRHGPMRTGQHRGRCGRSRACTAARVARDRQTSPVTAQDAPPEPAAPTAPPDADEALRESARRVREAVEALRSRARIVDYEWQPQPQVVRTTDRYWVTEWVSGEAVARGCAVSVLVREALERMGRAVLERFVLDGQRRLHHTSVDVEADLTRLGWLLHRSTTTPLGRVAIEALTVDGLQARVDTTAELRVDHHMPTNSYALNLTSGASTTVTWTATAWTNMGTTGSTYYYDPQTGVGNWATPTTTYYQTGLAEYRPAYRRRVEFQDIQEYPGAVEYWNEPAETCEQRAAREARAAELAEQRRLERERQRVERERQLAEYARREAEVQAEREAAYARARDLLYRLLTAEQRAEHADRGTITVRGSEGNVFRLETSHYAGNVSWVDEHGGDVLGTMCAHPRNCDLDGHGMPSDDIFAGQVLALQTDERGFVSVANHCGGRLPEYPLVEARPLRPEQQDLVQMLAG